MILMVVSQKGMHTNDLGSDSALTRDYIFVWFIKNEITSEQATQRLR